MSTRSSQPRNRSRSKAKSSTSGIPSLESASPALAASEDSVGGQGEEEASELGDVSIASSVGVPDEPSTPANSSSHRKKRSRLEISTDPSTPAPASAGVEDARSSTGGGDPSTKIRIPYSKLRGVLNSPLVQGGEQSADAPRLKITYSKPGQAPEKSGTLRLEFPDLNDYPATARSLSAVAKGDQYPTVAKREIEALRDEFERIRVELRNFDLEVRRELDVMAETRTGSGLPDPRASPALQRRRTEDVKPLRQSQSSSIGSSAIDTNKKRLKKLSNRRDEDESESIDVLDVDAKARARREQRKREKDALEAATAGESKKYNLKNRGKDNKKNSKAKKEDEEGEAESGEDGESLDAANLPSASGGHSNPFWAFVHQYIREFLEEDLLTLQARHLSSSDPAFMIPSLGRHWTEFRKPKSDDADGGAGEGDGEAQPLHCGDLTQRILASLIEDRLLPEQMLGVTDAPAGTPAAPPPATAAPAAATPITVTPAAAAVTPTTAATSTPSTISNVPLLQYDASAFEFPEAEAALPLSAPPVGDYSFSTMLSLEERIKMELKALGLFDPEENPLNHAQDKEEDNEIVQEIRSLQNQLREQVARNNSARERIVDLTSARMTEQKKDRDARGAHAELEKAYIRVVQRRKPKRKKGAGRKSGS